MMTLLGRTLSVVAATPLQRITVKLAAVNMATYRLVFVSQSVFFVAFLAAFGASNARTSAVFTVTAMMHVVVTLAVGATAIKVSPKRIIFWGSFVFGLGAFASAFAPNLMILTVTFGIVIATGTTMIGLVPTASLISKEFAHGRGLVIGMAFFVAALVSFLGVPLLQWINDTASWRVSLMLLGGVVILIVPLTIRTLDRREFDANAHAQVRPSAPGVLVPAAPLPKRAALRQWLADPAFRWLALAHSQIGIAIGAVLVPLVAHLADRGLTAAQGSLALATTVLFTAVGALGGGRFSDRVGRELAYSFANAFRLVGLAALFLIDAERWWLLIVFVVAYGIGWGSTGPVEIAIASDIYAGHRIGPRLGVLEAVTSGSYALAVFVVSFLRDLTGTYDLALLIAGVAGVLTTLAYWVAGPRHYVDGVKRSL